MKRLTNDQKLAILGLLCSIMCFFMFLDSRNIFYETPLSFTKVGLLFVGFIVWGTCFIVLVRRLIKKEKRKMKDLSNDQKLAIFVLPLVVISFFVLLDSRNIFYETPLSFTKVGLVFVGFILCATCFIVLVRKLVKKESYEKG